MKNNYPVKYSVVGIYDEIDRITKEPEQITYIASKCLVIEENIIYHEDGEKKKSYIVCFPFRFNTDLFSFVRSYPFSGYEEVNDVYDSYDEALEAAKSKNEEYISNKISFLPFDENFEINCEKITTKGKKYIEKYKKLEKIIEENTDDMIVGLVPKKQSIVLVTDKVKKVVDLSLYKALELYDNCNIIVYNLSNDEYDALKEDINEGISLTKYNNKCLVQYNSNKKIFKINNYDDKDKSYVILDSKLKLQKELTNNMIQEYFDDKPEVIIYTTETYEDIISSYVIEKHSYYDNDNEKTPINKKILFKFNK